MSSQALLKSIRPILILIILIWVIEIINLTLGHRLNLWLGLEPRSITGLVGVPTMPFLHGSIEHAAANTIPLIILGGIGVAVAPKRFWRASIAIVVVSGLAVWIMARPGIVVGASGLIFGWFGFLITLGAIERSLRAILGAVAVIILYGGMIWGIFPTSGVRISWEAHLFGAMAGALVVYLGHKSRNRH